MYLQIKTTQQKENVKMKTLNINQRIYRKFFEISELGKADDFANENDMTLEERMEAIADLKDEDIKAKQETGLINHCFDY